MAKTIARLLGNIVGRITLLFPTFDYLDYQVGIRKHDKKAKTTRSLANNWKYIPSFLLTGRKLFLDFWVVAKKGSTYQATIRYDWKLCFPDGKQVNDVGGNGIANMNQDRVYRAVLGLGHFSIPGQYRIELRISNDVNGDTLSEIIDFDVYSFGRIEYYVFQTCLLVIITLFFTAILRACGFPE